MDRECINGQGVELKVCDLPYGVRRIGKNGCGIIAIFNALILIGKQRKPEEVVNYAKKVYRARWMWGFFGTRPKKIGKILEKCEVRYRATSKEDEFEAMIYEGGVYIISVWNKKSVFGGIHTMAFTCNENKDIRVYNRYSNSKAVYTYKANENKSGLVALMRSTGRGIVLYDIRK